MRLLPLVLRVSAACLGIWLSCRSAAAPAPRIDRYALVTRHNPRIATIDPWAPLTVGNGQFCFTADVTGLQTFYDHYQKNGIGLETQARWAWHSNPNPAGYTLEDANRPFTAYGETIGYPTNERSEAGRWLRENPHTMPLGQLGFVDEKGAPLALADVTAVEQTLDLWTGELRSKFTWRGDVVEVSTVAAMANDGIAARVSSRAIADGKLRLRLAFPRGYDLKTKNNPALDWSAPESHRTRVSPEGFAGVQREGTPDKPDEKLEKNVSRSTLLAVHRERDDFRYGSTLKLSGSGRIEAQGPHGFVIRGYTGERTVELGWWLTGDGPVDYVEDWGRTKKSAAAHWEKFWRSGAAVDFAGSTDPRAHELERRVVLSQYLTAVQFAGNFPPQETGLTLSSWYGKHHTEMIWWHAAHFALWARSEYLAKNLQWYVGALPIARELAWSRGLAGARWAKMIGPDGRESPGGNPLIVWNQPHPIHLAELLYRNAPTAETLARYQDLVLETADAMTSMLHWDEAKQRYNLGPPLWIAQEIYDQATSMNPTYELSYWIRGLKIAQEWRERLGLPREKAWDERIARIAKLPVKDGKYVAIETTPDTWDNVASRHDHPSFLMALGQLPGDGVDRATMRRTLDAVLDSWDWEAKIWGWDYPMVAMTAARVGEPQKAVDVLLFTKGPHNHYVANGHCPQRRDLPVYLPANGALLSAVAMMAGGWDGAPTMDAPGFPKDGSWVVRSEGLRPLP